MTYWMETFHLRIVSSFLPFPISFFQHFCLFYNAEVHTQELGFVGVKVLFLKVEYHLVLLPSNLRTSNRFSGEYWLQHATGSCSKKHFWSHWQFHECRVQQPRVAKWNIEYHFATIWYQEQSVTLSVKVSIYFFPR